MHGRFVEKKRGKRAVLGCGFKGNLHGERQETGRPLKVVHKGEKKLGERRGYWIVHSTL